MSALHDPADDIGTIPLDMEAIAAQALGHRLCFDCDTVSNCSLNGCRVKRPATRQWFLEFLCEGAPFVWRGEACSEAAADIKARQELSARSATFNRFTACLVAAIES